MAYWWTMNCKMKFKNHAALRRWAFCRWDCPWAWAYIPRDKLHVSICHRDALDVFRWLKCIYVSISGQDGPGYDWERARKDGIRPAEKGSENWKTNGNYFHIYVFKTVKGYLLPGQSAIAGGWEQVHTNRELAVMFEGNNCLRQLLSNQFFVGCRPALPRIRKAFWGAI